MSEAEHPETEQSHVLSRHTTPTWEVELLISGVAVFAMLQLPGWLDDRIFALEPRVGDEWRLVLTLFYIYSKSAAIVLAVTFALHLFLRALWIALVGMHSVYPRGILLDRLRMGPIQRRIEESQADSTTDAIERADNRASVVFAIGVSIAQIIVGVCIVFCGTLMLATLLTKAVGLQVDTFLLMAGAFAVFMVPYAMVTWIDHAYGMRLHAGGAASRCIEALLRFYARAGMGRRNNHIIAILSSNGGERKMMALVVGVMLVALLGVSTTYFAMRRGSPLGSYSLFPDAPARVLDAAHYDDQRDPARSGSGPYVQSAIVTGPYLKLVVPYRPSRDEPAMRKRCPGQMHGLEDDALASARLSCLQSLHPVTLDGNALTDLRYEIASDPRTDRPALLAMIDVRDLPRGRHELRIARPLRADRERKAADRDPGYDAIVFWR